MIRFYNGKVLRFEGGMNISSDEVWTKDERIVYVGPKKDCEEGFTQEIDLKGNLLMPGFKNAHSHAPMSFLRSMADDRPLAQWLSEDCWPNEAKLTEDAVYIFMQLSILEYLSSGITASFEMYSRERAMARAAADAGFRAVLHSGMNNFDRDITAIDRLYQELNSFSPLVSYLLGIHGEYTTGMERLEYAVSLSHKYKAPAFTHLAETKKERDDCIERYGMSPTKLLDSIGFFDYGGGGFHCVWMDDEDWDIFAEKKLWAITCPASNLKLASGIAPVHHATKKSVRWAIGTDGPASNNALDFFREMYLVSALQKVREMDAAAMDANAVLEMACVNGARAIGLPEADDIAEGKLADLIVLDLAQPNMQPVHNLTKNIVYAGSKSNVLLTMIHGVIRYREGEFFIGTRPEELYLEAENFLKAVIRP